MIRDPGHVVKNRHSSTPSKLRKRRRQLRAERQPIRAGQSDYAMSERQLPAFCFGVAVGVALCAVWSLRVMGY